MKRLLLCSLASMVVGAGAFAAAPNNGLITAPISYSADGIFNTSAAMPARFALTALTDQLNKACGKNYLILGLDTHTTVDQTKGTASYRIEGTVTCQTWQ